MGLQNKKKPIILSAVAINMQKNIMLSNNLPPLELIPLFPTGVIVRYTARFTGT